MSLESNLKSIAESLATIAEHLTHSQAATVAEEVPPKPVAALVAAPSPPAASTAPPATSVTDTKPPVAPPASPPQSPAATATVAPPAPTVATAPASPPTPETMTVDELNSALVVEYHRIGGREGIVKCMADLGASSVNQLAVENYSVLLAAVKAIAVAG